jgi:hypothetical protein
MHGPYDRENRELLRRILEAVESARETDGRILNTVHRIEQFLIKRPRLIGGKVVLDMTQIQVGGTATATLVGVWSDGQQHSLDSTFQVQPLASNPSDVSVSTPGSDGSFVITGVAADAGDSITANVTRPDGTVISFTADTVTQPLVIVAAPLQLTGGVVVLK